MGIFRANGRRFRVAVSRARKSLLRSVAGARRTVSSGVALTYDDGPHPENSSAVLDALRSHGATATFFVVAQNALDHPEIVRRMVAEGHVVGTHSMHHRDLRRLLASEAWAEIADGVEAVASLLGSAPMAFRPPHGGLTLRLSARLRRSPFRVWLWAMDSDDWKEGMTPSTVADRVSRCREGDIVLLHDTLEDAGRTTELVLQRLQARNLHTVALGRDALV